MKALSIFAMMFLFIGCGKGALPWDKSQVGIQSVKPAEPEAFTYELGNASCTTGHHSFNSLAATCEALLNNELNNDCVENKRLKLYDSHCSNS
tara:strand:- start:276131 stop:276409 length:279 start_codon:yes stop_codon:yes gene_type:complete